MLKQKWRVYLILFLSLYLLTLLLYPGVETSSGNINSEEHYRMVDEEGNTIVTTGRRMKRGDAFLDTDNRLYRVKEVEEYLASAEYEKTVDLSVDLPANTPKAFNDYLAHSHVSPNYVPPLIRNYYSWAENSWAEENRQVQGDVEDDLEYTIGIYHTHNAESYIPTDGSEYIYGKGGIHRVGETFQESLESKGINVIYDETLHLPHDRGAYRRSRITANEIIRQGVDSVFDVHRDATPAFEYEYEMDGMSIAKVMMVVGRANPHQMLNKNFAYDLKAHADHIYPGLVRGVFVAHGNYNQDLSPLNLLLEVGTRSNPREDAKRGMELFADVVSYYFYGPEYLESEREESEGEAAEKDDENDELPPALYQDAGGVSNVVSTTVISILMVSLVAALGFFLLNNPGAGAKTVKYLQGLPLYLKDRFQNISLESYKKPNYWQSWGRKVRFNWQSSIRSLTGEIESIPIGISIFMKKARKSIRYQLLILPGKMEEMRANWQESIDIFRRELAWLFQHLRVK